MMFFTISNNISTYVFPSCLPAFGGLKRGSGGDLLLGCKWHQSQMTCLLDCCRQLSLMFHTNAAQHTGNYSSPRSQILTHSLIFHPRGIFLQFAKRTSLLFGSGLVGCQDAFIVFLYHNLFPTIYYYLAAGSSIISSGITISSMVPLEDTASSAGNSSAGAKSSAAATSTLA